MSVSAFPKSSFIFEVELGSYSMDEIKYRFLMWKLFDYKTIVSIVMSILTDDNYSNSALEHV